MRRLAALSFVAFACHHTPSLRSTSAEPRSTPAEPKPVVADPKPEPKPEPAKATCASAATKLLDEHGFGKIPENNKAGARRGGEAEIVAACIDDRWHEGAIECMTTRPSAVSCVGQLTTYQQKSFDLHLKDWERKWMVGPGEDPPEEEKPKPPPEPKTPPPPQREEWVSCELKEPAQYAPVIPEKAKARELAIAMRARVLEAQCYRWGNPEKKCFNAARDAAAIQACRDKLDENAKNAMTNALVEVDDDLKRIAALEKTPKAIDCKTVASLHYGDDAWRGHMLALPAVERKKLLAESRAKLTKSCTDEKWDATERACMVAHGGGERVMTECFPAKKYAFGMRWGYPPAGVMFKTGVADCDALGETVNKIATCDKYEAEMREMLLASWAMEMVRYFEWRGTREEVARSCRQANESYRESAKQKGCSI